MTVSRCIILFTLALAMSSVSAQSEPPIIDMHLHANTADQIGPPPLALCVPFVTQFPPYDASRPWKEIWDEALKEPPCADPIWSPMTDEALIQGTISVLERRNIIGVLSRSPEQVRRWRKAAPERFIPSLELKMDGNDVSLDEMRRLFKTKEFRVLGEVEPQYVGIAPDDERMAPYWELAEELDIPVAFHMAEGIPGINAIGSPNHRVRLTNPFLLEEVLIRHPRLRISVMHYGSPMIDEMIAMLAVYPQLYVDIGGMQWFYPRDYFYAQLKQFIDAGFGKRVMFGSDQMNWPGVIEVAIKIIDEAPFLSKGQKRDIFYNNAARFLRLSDEEIAAHHGR